GLHIDKDIRNATVAAKNIGISQHDVGLGELCFGSIPTNAVDALGAFMEPAITCLTAIDIMISHKGDCLRAGQSTMLCRGIAQHVQIAAKAKCLLHGRDERKIVEGDGLGLRELLGVSLDDLSE